MKGSEAMAAASSSQVCAAAVLRISIVVMILFLSGCSEIKPPSAATYISETPPPPKQEFRWSNGRMPRHLDPARASSAPETDIVRALYEGLTEIDPVTLEPVPAAAESWESLDNHTKWVFKIRRSARWTNGKTVTAFDFVSSWSRLLALGNRAANTQLFENFRGRPESQNAPASSDQPQDTFPNSFPQAPNPGNTNTSVSNKDAELDQSSAVPPAGPDLAFWAEDQNTLVVRLKTPDKDLPRLLANVIFRPVYGRGETLAEDVLTRTAVTNGPFSIDSIEPESITLVRSESYWDRGSVVLESVRFVAKPRAEEALEAYRAGEIDAVTNAVFEPLALKLLEAYEDLRKNTFAAVNFYQVNLHRAPFSDRRVRQALAIAIERERLTDGELAGSTRPAFTLLPFGSSSRSSKIAEDKERARDLLEEAGFADGENFPVLRLIVNRNDVQQRIARSVARMWKQNLNVETEIIVKETDEVRLALENGDYDLVRRGVVFPTTDEKAGLSAIFDRPAVSAVRPSQTSGTVSNTNSSVLGNSNSNISVLPPEIEEPRITEEIALYEMQVIPLYFPTSYSLVKPYVIGFEGNVLDAPLLQKVRIDNSWQPKTVKRES
ncbi:peptide ABC transporter substrate-binding protein [Leptolyngbya sp. 7M]|uniref:peptide ABC transporter substrate-binding protein n=1 Tax=Leptolyngbya sp. 7M TaxID=2812896 RepID=UPI001B8D3463|nr:peptide ABC transporter substrate-binding protein [Leptolyngbya sp. 7M]QYO65457.1 peptide ABC transporter substrate-binding protein [Leptolyngbya sp. 7M]